MVNTLRDVTQELLQSLETNSDSQISIPGAASSEKVVRRCNLWVPQVNVLVRSESSKSAGDVRHVPI